MKVHFVVNFAENRECDALDERKSRTDRAPSIYDRRPESVRPDIRLAKKRSYFADESLLSIEPCGSA